MYIKLNKYKLIADRDIFGNNRIVTYLNKDDKYYYITGNYRYVMGVYQ